MKRQINWLLGLFGKEIRATHAPIQTFERGIQCLKDKIVEVVVDVGVAHGTPELYKAFRSKKFLLVEANPSYRHDVEMWAKKLKAGVEMVFCGAEKGQTTLLVPGSAQSGSRYRYEGRAITEEIPVPVETLDSLMEKHSLQGTVLLKVDAEGSEMEVLQGATETLRRCAAVILEIHFGKGYEGQVPAEELIAHMYSKGFRMYNIMEGGGIDKHGRITHADFIFLKT